MPTQTGYCYETQNYKKNKTNKADSRALTCQPMDGFAGWWGGRLGLKLYSLLRMKMFEDIHLIMLGEILSSPDETYGRVNKVKLICDGGFMKGDCSW